jgi:hypothetical protein
MVIFLFFHLIFFSSCSGEKTKNSIFNAHTGDRNKSEISPPFLAYLGPGVLWQGLGNCNSSLHTRQTKREVVVVIKKIMIKFL